MSPTNNGMPKLEIIFKGLGVSAVKRGERGTAVLILVDDTTKDYLVKYKSIEDFTTEEQAKFEPEHVLFIKDALEGIPLELYVATTAKETTDLATTLLRLKGAIPRNSWVGIASSVQTNQDDLITWVKAQRKNNKKRYKAITYKGTTTDDMGIVNVTTEKVTFKDDRGEVTGDNAIPFLLGYLAGLPLSMSAIAKPLTKFKCVTEPDEKDDAISTGEFILFNDEGIVKVARGVNSLVTLGQDVTLEMTHINTVEKMDLIYCDIYNAWNDNFKGKYDNFLDNQMLLFSAINAYLGLIALDKILDPTFDNRVELYLEKQKLANYPKYGKEVVDKWSDIKIMQMTVLTNVYPRTNIKITGIMEDFFMDIFM
ncbi:MAG: phage tail sheath protein [Psychrilyobacter sp.]|uniref:phage tail sheath protein n=1 Tax=Psychrilyobacter sp. TaxID=2586924 RepID=UPI003C775E6C